MQIRGYLVLLSFLTITVTSALSQVADRVEIYAIPLYSSFALENISADYVRAHPEYQITILSRKQIDKFIDAFTSKHALSGDTLLSTLEPKTGVRIVIDFIGSSQLRSFILVTSNNSLYIDFSLDTDLPETNVHMSLQDMCKLHDFIFIWDLLNYTPLRCD